MMRTPACLTFIAAAISSFILVSCSGRPDNVLSDSRMSDLLAELHVADAYADRPGSEYASDSARKILRQAVLKDNDVSEEQFQASLDWYGYNMDRYTKLYEEVEKKLSVRMGKAGQHANKKDLPDLWTLSKMITIFPADYATGFSFSIPAEGIEPGSQLEWRMNIKKMYSEAQLLLGVDYEDLDSEFQTSEIATQGRSTVALTLDSVRSIKRLYGYVHLSSRPEGIVWIDSLQLLKTPPGKRQSAFIGSGKRFRIPAKKPHIDSISIGSGNRK